MTGTRHDAKVRQLLPVPADAELDDGTLDAVYAYPGDRPWLRANMVCSADGAATTSGASQDLSGATDRKVFHRLRALSDVILVGAGTARTERYTAVRLQRSFPEARLARGQAPTPTIAVVSASLDLDPSSRLFRDAPARTLVLTCAGAPADALRALREVADVVVAGDRQVDLAAALDELATRGLSRMLCEGGPSLLAGVTAAGRLDELCLTVSPLLTGGTGHRIFTGPELSPHPPLQLATLLEEDGALFARYLRR
jgi:riboflavin biosynthesis pyrimidine reductase